MGLRCQFLFEEHPQGARGLYENGFSGRCVSIKDKCSVFHVVNQNQMNVFKDISSATASRDLKKGIELGLIEASGNLNKTKYKVN
jgi:hypothetical protein